MPPKQRITREMILERAFSMFCKEGMEVVNARSVAKALNCSTQPIFSYYSGMQDLKNALDLKAQEIYRSEVISAPKGENWIVDLYSAHVRFACKRPCLHMHLFDAACQDKSRMDAFKPLTDELTVYVQQKEGFDEATAGKLVKELSVYASGLAALAMMDANACGDVPARIGAAYASIRDMLK